MSQGLRTIKRFALLVAISLISTAGVASATVQAQAANALTIGMIDVQKIILTSAEGKSARATLEKEVKQKEKELTDLEKGLETMAQDIQGKAALMSPEARAAKQKEFQTKISALQQKKMQFNVEVKRKEQEATQKIARKVALVAEGIAKAKKIDLIFESNSAGLMYAKTSVDLTDEVLKLYDKAPAAAKAK